MKNIGKYQDALSALCGVDYPYMQGDPDVGAMIELIALAIEQEATIQQIEAKIGVMEKLLIGTQVEVSKKIEAEIKNEARKEFWEALKEYMDLNDGIKVSDVDSFLEELDGDNNG